MTAGLKLAAAFCDELPFMECLQSGEGVAYPGLFLANLRDAGEAERKA